MLPTDLYTTAYRTACVQLENVNGLFCGAAWQLENVRISVSGERSWIRQVRQDFMWSDEQVKRTRHFFCLPAVPQTTFDIVRTCSLVAA